MKTLFAAPALAAVLALVGTAAMAGAMPAYPGFGPAADNHLTKIASNNSASQCTALETQFDGAIKSHETSSKAAAAKTLRQDGGQLCASGKTNDGIKKLEQALNDIGVKPVMVK